MQCFGYTLVIYAENGGKILFGKPELFKYGSGYLLDGAAVGDEVLTVTASSA